MATKKRRTGAFGDRSRARRRALQALYQWAMTGQETADICRQFGQEQDLRKVDVAYFEELVGETVARQVEIEEKLKAHLDRELERLDPMEAAILRLASYEFLFRPEVPYRVVIDEAVGLGQDFGSEQTPAYINGVLDNCAADWRADEYDAKS